MTEVTELTADELTAMLDREARRHLGISGAEFAGRWHAGAYRDDQDPAVTRTAMLLPDAW
jgi:hypothetical protein